MSPPLFLRTSHTHPQASLHGRRRHALATASRPPHTPSPYSLTHIGFSVRSHSTLQLVHYSDDARPRRRCCRIAHHRLLAWFTPLSYLDYISCVFVQYSRWSFPKQESNTHFPWRVHTPRGRVRGPRVGQAGEVSVKDSLRRVLNGTVGSQLDRSRAGLPRGKRRRAATLHDFHRLKGGPSARRVYYHRAESARSILLRPRPRE